ncbi:MAG: lysophospholipid acyltransferase family protein [Geobacteraceae bacterium]|nr:lysophospholipid acyltransferase family protein [Geobacteraceae bacterium]
MKELRRRIVAWFTGSFGAYLIYVFICFIYKTLRVSIVGQDHYRNLVRTEKGVIGIFWHGRMLMMPFLYPGSNISILISAHRDGEIIANVMKLFGFGLVRGSSKKGGSAALREMLRVLKSGGDLGVTPDGPKGPAESVKPGVAETARMSGKYIIPTTFSAKPCIRATSWDRFMIPLPFSKVVLYAGTPLKYEEGEDMESFRLRIEESLRQANVEADRHLG